MWQSEQIMSCSNDFTSSFVALETKGQVEHTALWDKVFHAVCSVVYCAFCQSSGYSMHTENVHAVHSMHTSTYCRNLKIYDQK